MAQVTHTVVKGDTLYAIAKKYNTTVNAIAKLNNIQNVNLIYVGQVLVISGDSSSGSTATTRSTTSNKAVVDRFGLISNTERGMYAGWTWNKENTDHYEYVWYYSWGVGIAAEERGETTAQYCTFTAPDYATHVSFTVKPISKTYKSGSGDSEKEVHYWTAGWSTNPGPYWFSENPPLKPNTPEVTIKDYTLTAFLDNLQDLNADSIEFQVYQDDGRVYATQTVPITANSASCTFTVEPGHEYKVRARSVRDGLYSDWSDNSGNQQTKPSAPGGITACRATSATSVYLAWDAVQNADSYDIEYTTKMEYFESNQTSTQSGIKSTQYTMTGLESGQRYFFRVRAVNSAGESAWTSAKSVIIGKKPSPPTTWSSTTTVVVGEPLYLYWIHNSEDGSKQVKAELELNVDGEVTTKTITNPTADDEEAEDKTSIYTFDTSGYTEGMKLKWRVKTCGITGEYSDWSIQRVVDVYAPPTLSMNLLDLNSELLETLTSFPFAVDAVAGPNTQSPIGYHLSITANESYETVDPLGNKLTINKDGEVYSKYFDISENLFVTLYPNDLDLENNISYTVHCIVTMNSGLTGEAKATFTVAWTDEIYEPNAEIGINKNTYSAVIRPYCEAPGGKLIEDVTLSVYRRMYDGSYVEIATGLINTQATFVVDPHPALDLARYRIVAVSQTTGSVSYTDVAQAVGGIAVIIQWDEEWTDFDVIDTGEATEREWTGSMLKLPYNIDITANNALDVAHIEYIGRKNPVSYYGTQLGETATWNVDIPKYDKETLYALRRLSMWTGDVYVREPSGSGYWATIRVSYNIKHCEVVIPITFNITKVEGGV